MIADEQGKFIVKLHMIFPQNTAYILPLRRNHPLFYPAQTPVRCNRPLISFDKFCDNQRRFFTSDIFGNLNSVFLFFLIIIKPCYRLMIINFIFNSKFSQNNPTSPITYSKSFLCAGKAKAILPLPAMFLYRILLNYL